VGVNKKYTARFQDIRHRNNGAPRAFNMLQCCR